MLGKDEKATCSFCESDNVTLMAPFGTAQLVRQYYCHDCKSAFEFIRWREKEETNGAR